MASSLGKIDETVDTTTEASIHAEENQHSVKEGKNPKVHKDRLKRLVSDRVKAGRESSYPVILDKAALHARQTNAELPRLPIPTIPPPPPPPQTSRFTTSSATFPNEGHGENWHPQDPYRQDPQYEKSWNDQWRSESYVHHAPQQDYRQWESHRPLPYGHHPSSSYTSSLHVPRDPQRNDYQGPQQSASVHSWDLHFWEFQMWLPSQQLGFQWVRPNSFHSYLIPCPGKIIKRRIFV
jgi:hypothetical protein